MKKRIQLLGFAPDLSADQPGVIIGSNRVIPTSRGFMAGAQAATTNSAVTLAGEPTGVFATKVPNGTAYYYVGSAAKIEEVTAAGGTLTDRSGATYNSSVTFDGAWSFSQFGAITLAINKNDTLQAATTGSGSFAAVSGAPKAAIVITAGLPTAPFAMTFNYNDGTDTPDGIFWSALADYTDWTPDIATECGNVRIFEPAGPFTAAIRFRDGAVAWKEDSMFVGTYVGGDDVWSWQKIASDIGCSHKNLCTEYADKVYFADKRGLWMFDGSYPQQIPGYVHDFWSREIHAATQATLGHSGMRFDPWLHVLWVCGPGGYCLCWNVLSGLWTHHGRIINGTPRCIEQITTLAPNGGIFPTGFAVMKNGSSYYVDQFTYGDAYTANGGETFITATLLGDPEMQTYLSRLAPVWLFPWAVQNGGYMPTTGMYTPDSNAQCVVDANSSMPVGTSNAAGDQGTKTANIDGKGRYFDLTISGNYLTTAIIKWNKGEFRDIVATIDQAGTA